MIRRWRIANEPNRKLRIGGWIAVGMVMCAANSVAAQTLGGAVDDGISLWRVVGAFLLCVALGVAAIFALRARGGNPQLLSAGRRLRLVETLRVGRQSHLSIVACDGKELLLLTSEQSAQFVGRLPLAEADAAPSSGAQQ